MNKDIVYIYSNFSKIVEIEGELMIYHLLVESVNGLM